MVEAGSTFVNSGPATAQWSAWSDTLMKPAGIDIYQITHLGEIVQQNGLSCQIRVYNIPVGTWGGRIGVMLEQDLLSIYESLVPRYQKTLGVSPVTTNLVHQQYTPCTWHRDGSAYYRCALLQRKRCVSSGNRASAGILIRERGARRIVLAAHGKLAPSLSHLAIISQCKYEFTNMYFDC